MLIEMLKSDPNFQNLSNTHQRALAKLAEVFEGDVTALYATPAELQERFRLGSYQNWFEFLNMETVRRYIKAQLAFQAEVAQRASIPALSKAAKEGDIQAAKMIENLSGILNSGDRNRVVVLHRIDRPQTKTEETNNEGKVDLN